MNCVSGVPYRNIKKIICVCEVEHGSKLTTMGSCDFEYTQRDDKRRYHVLFHVIRGCQQCHLSEHVVTGS